MRKKANKETERESRLAEQNRDLRIRLGEYAVDCMKEIEARKAKERLLEEHMKYLRAVEWALVTALERGGALETENSRLKGEKSWSQDEASYHNPVRS